MNANGKDCLEEGFKVSIPDGLVLEFGVWTGGTLKKIAAAFPTRTVYGFDWFHGLPMMWRPGFGEGSFSQAGAVPKDLPKNVELVIGKFENTVCTFIDKHQDEQVAFVHIDCDLYSSTKTILDALSLKLASGCVMVFDKLVNYPEYRSHELRALYEYLKSSGRTYEWINCSSPTTPLLHPVPGQEYAPHQKVALRLL